jgi:hypothetical protein
LRIKTIPKIVEEIRSLDSMSAVGESFLIALAEANELPHTYHGNRLVADAESVSPTLNRLLGFEGREDIPHIRSIRGAVAELKERTVNIGIGEKMIRSAVKDGRIPCIRIGNREYIAMQSFDEPYCNRIFEKTTLVANRTETIKRDVMAQMSEVLASNPTVQTVVRVRRAS